MASGLGPNLILGPGRDLFASLLGYNPGKKGFEEGTGQFQLFGPNPMQGVSDAMQWGRQGQFVSRGPQSTGFYDQYGSPLDSFSYQVPTGIKGALFGNSYGQGFGEGAYQRFQDAGDSYLRRYGKDLRDASGNVIALSPESNAGARLSSQFGGRNGFNAPITGSQYDTHKTFGGLLALQQGANPYLNDPSRGAGLVRQNELDSPFARADPQGYLDWARYSDSLNPTTGDVANSYVRPTYNLGGESVDRMQGMTNAYEQQLMQQMAQQGERDLSLGLQDSQNTMAAMGLGRSGAGQTTALGAWRDIQDRNALQRQQLMAQFREAGMNREADAILGQQQGGINAALAAQQLAGQGSESRLNRGYQATMGGLDALTGSLEASRAAERGALGSGLDRTLQWNLGTQGNYLQSLLGSDEASLNRMIAESQEQSRGLQDYMGLQGTKDQMYNDRLNTMLGLEDRYRTSQNEVLNQMREFGMLPLNYLMQGITGIQTGGVGGSRTSPWGPMLAQAGLDYAGGLLGQMGRPPMTSVIPDEAWTG